MQEARTPNKEQTVQDIASAVSHSSGERRNTPHLLRDLRHIIAMIADSGEERKREKNQCRRAGQRFSSAYPHSI